MNLDKFQHKEYNEKTSLIYSAEGKTMALHVELLQYTKEPEKIISAAAKLCYSSSGVQDVLDGLDEAGVQKFLNMLMDLGHESPIEHVCFTFGVEGVSRSLLAQLTRHRIASYSVKSQRYVKEGQFEFITPPAIAEDRLEPQVSLVGVGACRASSNREQHLAVKAVAPTLLVII